MTEKYTLMIYFAVAMLHSCQKNVEIDEQMNVSIFRKTYPELVKHVFDEALLIYKYELSMNQMGRAITVFIMNHNKAKQITIADVKS